MKVFWIVVLASLLASGFYYRYHTNAADERGATVLMRSFEKPTDIRQVHRLIKHAKNMNEKDKTGQTALFYAVKHSEQAAIVEQLIKAGADVAHVDKSGRGILMVAVRHNPSVDILRVLLKNGAPVNVADEQGQTALLEAAQYATPQMVRLLLRAGADPEAVNNAGENAAMLLRENEHFTEEEKNNYTQALVVLSVIGPVQPAGI